VPEPESDVLIVGAGAGGLAAAWRLVSRGARVTLLEAGRRYRAQRDYPQTRADFEIQEFPYDALSDERGKPRYGFGSAQRVEDSWRPYRSFHAVEGPETGDRRRYVGYSHVRGVGGTTLHFQGESHRYHPDSLRMASLFGVGVDWPLDYPELERYYDLAERCIGVAAPSENPFRPRASSPVLPPHPLSYASARLAPAFARAGLTLIPNALAILSRVYAGRPPCNYCNACAQGCPLGDKGSADVTFLPAARATGRLDLVTEAQALRIELDRAGKARGVVWADAHGVERRAAARWLVLAGGAIETPRLLLASASRTFPNGIGNGSGQVGGNLTELLFWAGVALLPERVDAHRGQPIDGCAWNRSVPSAHPSGWVGGFRVAAAHGGAGIRGPVAYARRFVPGFGAAHQRRMAELFGRAVSVHCVGDWLPNAATRVDLDPILRDRFGQPVARITSHLGENERRLVKEMADTGRGVLSGAGGRIVEEQTALDLFWASHVLGTCRIGSDPRSSVADPGGFCHEVPNLAFADGSLVPSSGSGDAPSLTIAALALRTADRLAEKALGRS